LFINSGVDFDLQNASPAINTGTMDAVNAGYKTSMNGLTVPDAGGVDRGTYQY